MLQNSKSEEDLLDHYNANPSYYSSINMHSVLQLINQIGIKSLENMSVLDIGCGDARLLPIIEPMGIKAYTGIDYSEVRVKIAEKVETKREKKIINTSIQNFLNNNQDKFDLVFIFEVLEHLEEPRAIIELLRNISANIVGSVPVNMPYKAHLQVYRNKEEVETALNCDVLYTRNGHFFFSIRGTHEK